MPDLFGKKQLGRATTGGRFYATPTERVEAGAVYFPDESNLLFGVAEYTVEAGNLGAFATVGTFLFEKPSDWLDSLGRKVFYRPSTGEIVNQDRKGDVLIGFQVLANVPDDKLGVVLTSGENSVVIIVTSTADSGAGSLRQAIADAHDGDVILFDSDVFPVGQTTAILLSSYITVNKSVSVYGGFSDGQGGYTSGATKRYYVYRDIEDVQTKVYIDENNPALEGETVLFDLSCRVALDGQSARRCLFSSFTGSATFSGIAFIHGQEHGSGTSGGGASMRGESSNLFSDCYFYDCLAASGAGFHSLSSSNTLNNCVFENNSTNGSNGGIYLTGVGNKNTFNDCVVVNCTSLNGGGICTTNSTLSELNRCVIFGCSAANGGGFYSSSTGQNMLNDCTIKDCHGTVNGAGIYTASTSQNTFNNCIITGCQNDTYGGGLFSYSASRNILNGCQISDCSANMGAGVYSRDTSQNTLNNCTITGCSATTNGGGLMITGSSIGYLNNCIVANCTANSGGGLRLGSTTATINACVFDATSTVVTPNDGTIIVTGGITTIAAATINAATITIADGAALTITTSATIGAATFTSEGRGYLATAAGIDISSATLTNVVACSYGAGLESFEISADGATWTAQDLTTPILIEKKGDGATWTTLSDDATGGSYSDSFEIGTTLRAFDGVRFLVASLDAYWQVDASIAANANGGGGTGDASPAWTIETETITPNIEV